MLMSNRKLFNWKKWKDGELPSLELHSQAKLDLLADYVTTYIEILCHKSWGQNEFKITLVDGFAGGGIYHAGQQGSPFVLIRAVRAAEAKLNLNRDVPLKIDAHFYFVERSPFAFECLRNEIKRSEFRDDLERTISLRRGRFTEHSKEIIHRTNERHTRGGGRVIFFLDQCGYTGVDPVLLKDISSRLNNKAEFVINFAVDWFEDFISDSEQFRKIFNALKLGEHLDFDYLLRLKKLQSLGFPFLVESKLAPAYWKASELPYFSPFYIQPEGRSRGYWLLHLAPHPRARSAMADVHWRNANGSRHYGGRGLEMFAFKPDRNEQDFLVGMSFSEITRDTNKEVLRRDLADRIKSRYSNGVTFHDLLINVSNETTANISLIRETIEELIQSYALDVRGPEGGQKRTNAVHDNDILKPASQLVLTGF